MSPHKCSERKVLEKGEDPTLSLDLPCSNLPDTSLGSCDLSNAAVCLELLLSYCEILHELSAPE